MSAKTSSQEVRDAQPITLEEAERRLQASGKSLTGMSTEEILIVIRRAGYKLVGPMHFAPVAQVATECDTVAPRAQEVAPVAPVTTECDTVEPRAQEVAPVASIATYELSTIIENARIDLFHIERPNECFDFAALYAVTYGLMKKEDIPTMRQMQEMIVEYKKEIQHIEKELQYAREHSAGEVVYYLEQALQKLQNQPFLDMEAAYRKYRNKELFDTSKLTPVLEFGTIKFMKDGQLLSWDMIREENEAIRKARHWKAERENKKFIYEKPKTIRGKQCILLGVVGVRIFDPIWRVNDWVEERTLRKRV
jgi:hypothetical protein